jgi:hypothetical protein
MIGAFQTAHNRADMFNRACQTTDIAWLILRMICMAGESFLILGKIVRSTVQPNARSEFG